METSKNTRDAALALGALLRDHKGGSVMVLDVSGSNTWADYFVIATVTSSAHSRGLQKHVYESIKDLGLEIRPARRKLPDGDEWALIDLGDVVVHLMTETARKFYDLERLWFGAKDILAG
ncbi:MAG TPA: ribosome silencing factor [Treponemataceae bacterium]|nr:ribosome silencing factor [Treponemataceae bacterium]